MAACPNCGTANAEGANFCSVCGTRLDVAEAAEVRKTVTILFCDVTGSTELGEQLDPSPCARVMELFGRDAEVRAARERALEMFEEKGDLVSAARTRSLLERA